MTTTERHQSPIRPHLGLADLAERQVLAIDAFHRRRRAAERAAAQARGSRELRLDAARQLDVVRRQHESIVGCTRESLRTSVEVLRSTRPLRGVVAGRDDWFGRTMAGALVAEGFELLAQLDNGADAVGVAIAEQPDLLVLEDPLPMMTAEQVVSEVHLHSPCTFVAVRSVDARSRLLLLQAGASSVCLRPVHPRVMAQTLVDAVTAA